MPPGPKFRRSTPPDGQAAHDTVVDASRDGGQMALAFPSTTRPARVALEERWLQLTHVILPGLATQHRWSLSLNHCFMRVCLDISLGAPWHTVVKRPAIRHMTDDQLRSAIDVAEQIVETPEVLFKLNWRSIEQRKSMPGRRQIGFTTASA